MSKPKKPKRPVPLNEIEEHLREQLAFLEKSARDFDGGDTSEFKRMATAIRTLVYDGPSSRSVASQLGLKSDSFLAFGGKITPGNLLTDWPLAIIRMGPEGGQFLPALDQGPFSGRGLDFETWWSEPVIKDVDGVTLSRGDLVLLVANQAGGAHVDPEIDERYHRLAKEHSIGMMAFKGGLGAHPGLPPEDGVPLEHIEKVYLRHVAFEVLASLKPALQRILGNRGCECGSGRKARYCCLKERQHGVSGIGARSQGPTERPLDV